MSTKSTKEFDWLFGALFAAVIVLAAYAISWIITCGIIKLITICFGWSFSWAIATGVWLIICVARSIFKSDVTVKK